MKHFIFILILTMAAALSCEDLNKDAQNEINAKNDTQMIKVTQGDEIPSGGLFTFGPVGVNKEGGDVRFTIENLHGEWDLNLTGTPAVVVSGTNSSDFTVVEQPETTTIPPRGNTSFTLNFSPTETGTRGGQETLVSIPCDDALNGNYAFAVSGISEGPEISVSHEYQENPIVENNGTASISASNNAPASFNITINNNNRGDLILQGTSPYAAISGTHSSNYYIAKAPNGTIGYGDNTIITINGNSTRSGVTESIILTIYSNDEDEGTFILNIDISYEAG